MRVLLAANTAATLSPVGIELMQTGFAVSTAQRMDEALIQLGAHSYDALIVDYTPFPESLRLLGIVQQRHPTVATIVVVPQSEPALLEAAFHAGAFDVLLMPIAPPLLQAALRRIDQCQQWRQAAQSSASGSGSNALLHDINNQLTGIQGIAQLYLTDPDLASDLRDGLNEIVENARRISDLIQQARQSG